MDLSWTNGDGEYDISLFRRMRGIFRALLGHTDDTSRLITYYKFYVVGSKLTQQTDP